MKFLRGMFGRDKSGTFAVSNHKVLGTVVLGIAVGLAITGATPPAELWWTVWGLLGIGVAKQALDRRGPPAGGAP